VTNKVQGFYPGYPTGTGAFAWNPKNGDQLAVVRDTLDAQGAPVGSGIFAVQYDGSTVTPLSKFLKDPSGAPLYVLTLMDWSPDGSKIAFEAATSGSIYTELYVVDVATQAVTRLTDSTQGDNLAPVFSPDGTQILFKRILGGYQNFWRMNADGSGQVQITDDIVSDYIAQAFSADWSPDGTQITLNALGSTLPEIFTYVIPASTTSANYQSVRRLLGPIPDGTSSVDDLQPSWRP